MKPNPLKRFLLLAVLWLPAMFFVWVYLSSVFSLPATSAASAILESRFGGIFQAAYVGYPSELIDPDAAVPTAPGTPRQGSGYRYDHLLVLRYNERAMPEPMRAERRAGTEILVPVNSMVYGYGLALIWGLIMATPLSARRRLIQMAAGWAAIVVVQIFGLVTNALIKAMQHLGGATLAAEGIWLNLLAAGYQFGYLILPAVVPVVLWVLMNRAAIEQLTGRIAEPVPVAPVEPAAQPPVAGPEREPEN